MDVGECVVATDYDGEVFSCRIVKADPYTWIANGLYEMALTGDAAYIKAGEGIFVIYGSNRTVRYALGEYLTAQDAWTATLIASRV